MADYGSTEDGRHAEKVRRGGEFSLATYYRRTDRTDAAAVRTFVRQSRARAEAMRRHPSNYARGIGHAVDNSTKCDRDEVWS